MAKDKPKRIIKQSAATKHAGAKFGYATGFAATVRRSFQNILFRPMLRSEVNALNKKMFEIVSGLPLNTSILHGDLCSLKGHRLAKSKSKHTLPSLSFDVEVAGNTVIYEMGWLFEEFNDALPDKVTMLRYTLACSVCNPETKTYETKKAKPILLTEAEPNFRGGKLIFNFSSLEGCVVLLGICGEYLVAEDYRLPEHHSCGILDAFAVEGGKIVEYVAPVRAPDAPGEETGDEDVEWVLRCARTDE